MTIEHRNKLGILLVNLGSPASPSTSDVRRFLRTFLSDPRVVNLPRILWWLILNLFVLPFRPAKSAHAYRSIWTAEGSPLVVFTQQLTAKLKVQLANDVVLVDCAMRYGEPALSKQLTAFKNAGVTEIVIVPLYPQFSTTTTSSIFDVVSKDYLSWQYLPSLRFISAYYHHPLYIAALAASVHEHRRQFPQADLLLMSFHGLPAKLTELGDPYFYHCQRTARLLANELGLGDDQWQMVFQSRFGKAKWLQPYCVQVLQDLPQQGIKNIDVICPGFAVDCLETLEEIAITNQEIFKAAGGGNYHYIPALNASESQVQLIIDLLKHKVDG